MFEPVRCKELDPHGQIWGPYRPGGPLDPRRPESPREDQRENGQQPPNPPTPLVSPPPQDNKIQ